MLLSGCICIFLCLDLSLPLPKSQTTEKRRLKSKCVGWLCKCRSYPPPLLPRALRGWVGWFPFLALFNFIPNPTPYSSDARITHRMMMLFRALSRYKMNRQQRAALFPTGRNLTLPQPALNGCSIVQIERLWTILDEYLGWFQCVCIQLEISRPGSHTQLSTSTGRLTPGGVFVPDAR